MPPSLSDVAARAGVSRATASRALSNVARFAPSNRTQERVRRVAEEIGYQPNVVAQSLRRRRSHHIGFYAEFLDAHHPFMAEVLNGLLAGCATFEQDLVLHTPTSQAPDDIYRALIKGNRDGLVLVYDTSEALLTRLAASEIPVILLATRFPGFPTVHVDGRDGSRQLATYLAGKGHTHVLYLEEATGHGDMDGRQSGFCEAAFAQGIHVTQIRAASSYGEIGSDVDDLLASQTTRPTATVCYNDHLAYKMMDFCAARGLRVPDDMAVTGFDGTFTWTKPAVRLTTIAAPWAEAAKKTVALLMDALEGKPVPMETILPVTLIPGDSA